MSDDLMLVKKLEKEIGIELKQLSMEKIGNWQVTGFAADDNGRVRSLKIRNKNKRRLPALLSKFQRLEKLDLAGNKINDISSLKELKNLKIIILINNKITHMPAEFLDLGLEIKWELARGDGIFLKGNPLESPPAEIIKKGNEAIRQYFKSLAGEEQALNEVKVLLVGDGAAGKTSLAKALLGQPFDIKESQTHGININTMDINVNNTIIKLRLWDFGGQEIMHATHRFFLSKRSLYILVLDGRKDEKTEYWLNHIESFGGDSALEKVNDTLLEVVSFRPKILGLEVDVNALLEKLRGKKKAKRKTLAHETHEKKTKKENSNRTPNPLTLIPFIWLCL